MSWRGWNWYRHYLVSSQGGFSIYVTWSGLGVRSTAFGQFLEDAFQGFSCDLSISSMGTGANGAKYFQNFLPRRIFCRRNTLLYRVPCQKVLWMVLPLCQRSILFILPRKRLALVVPMLLSVHLHPSCWNLMWPARLFFWQNRTKFHRSHSE